MKCYYHPDRDVVGQCSRCGKFACRECIEDVGGAMLCTACQRLAEEEIEAETRERSRRGIESIDVAGMLALMGALGGGWIAVDAWSWEVAVVAIPGLAYLGWGLAWGWPPVWRRWSDTLGGRHYPTMLFMWVITLLFWFVPLSIAIGYGCLGGGIKRYLRARADVRLEKAEMVAKIEKELATFEQTLALNPNDVTAWDGKGTDLLNLRRFQEAYDAFTRAATLAPNEGCHWSGKGSALNGLGRYKEALMAFDHALTIDPELEDAWSGEATAYWKLHHYRKAWDAFDRAFALAPL